MAIEEAACNCYDSKPSKNGRIMDACYESGHQSVLEFADFTFHIEGVSRALLAQLTRHRLSSFSVRSQRYVLEDGFKYVTPKSIQNNPEALQEYQELMAIIDGTYNKLTHDYNIPAEDGRFVLPNACCTTLEYSTNLRSLIHFMNERLCSKAQWEIRKLAKLIKDEVVKVCPKFDRYLVPKCEMYSNYPFCTEKKSCGRHPKLVNVYNPLINYATNAEHCMGCGTVIPEGYQVCQKCLGEVMA